MPFATKTRMERMVRGAQLEPGDRRLVRHVRTLVALIDTQHEGIASERDDAAIATALQLSLDDYYKVRRLAIAAELLVEV